MGKVINIQVKLNNPNRSKNKDLSHKNTNSPKDKINLIPRENKILLEIIEEEIMFLDEELQELRYNHNHTKNNEITVTIEELQAYYSLFESINEKVRDGFGLDFLPNLTLRELANLAAAVEERLGNLTNQDFKKEIYDLHDKLMFHFIKIANSSKPDTY